jgi:hypothetical protein
MGKREGGPRYISEEFLAAMVVLVAAIVRVLHVLFTARLNPLAHNLILDSAVYDRWAKAIVWGGELPATRLMQAPLYPWFLSLVYRVFGPNLTAVRSVQAVLGILACAFITIYARRLFRSSTAGIISGLLAALYLPSIFYEGVILPATLILFLNALFLLLMVPDSRPAGPARLMAAGFVLGLSVMAKPVALLLLPFGILHIRMTRNHSSHEADDVTDRTGPVTGARFIRYSLALVIGLVFAVAPLTIRNARMTGTFIPLTTGGGINLYIGNNPNANGFYAVPSYNNEPLGGTPEVQHERMRRFAESTEGRELSPGEISSFWTREALRYIAAEPGASAKLAFRKFLYFFNRYERVSVESISFHKRFGGIIALPLPGYWFIVSFALIGIVLTRKIGDRLFLMYGGVLTYLAAAVVFYMLARYRLPVVVFLIPFAGAALMLILKMIRDRKRFDLLIITIAAVLAFYATGLTIAKDTAYGKAIRLVRLGKIYATSGEMEKALRLWREALEIDPENPEALKCFKGPNAPSSKATIEL